jgi:hypothetical protein
MLEKNIHPGDFEYKDKNAKPSQDCHGNQEKEIIK